MIRSFKDPPGKRDVESSRTHTQKLPLSDRKEESDEEGTKERKRLSPELPERGISRPVIYGFRTVLWLTTW